MTLLASMHIPDTGNDSTASKHTLFVEVELRDQSRFLHREVKAQLSGWLRKNFAQLRVGQDLDLSGCTAPRQKYAYYSSATTNSLPCRPRNRYIEMQSINQQIANRRPL